MRSSQSHTAKDEKNPSSFYSFISRATGWINPFNYISTRQAGVLTSSVILMQQVGQASAEVCFEVETHDFTLRCIKSSIESSIYEAAKLTCHAYQDGMDDCARYFKTTLYFGKTVFGNSICNLSFHSGSPSAHNIQCLSNVINDNIVDVAYGGTMDVLATIGIAAAGLCVTGIAGYQLFHFFKRRCAQGELQPLLESGLDSPEKSFEKLSEQLQLLKSQGLNDERLLQLENDMKEFREQYRDAVSLKIMFSPYQIDCQGKHTFDAATIAELNQANGCPCCRGAFDKDNIVKNGVVTQEILNGLANFAERIELLMPKSTHELPEVREVRIDM